MSKKRNGEIGERKVRDYLDKLEGYHQLINNLTLEDENGFTHQIDHIFINHSGVFVIESKAYFGEISGEEKDSILFKKVNDKVERISNPIKQNRSHVKIVKKTLKNKINPISVVVFSNNNAPYFPNENVINLDDLSLFISSFPTGTNLSKEDIDLINDILLKSESDKSMQEHLDNIKLIKRNRESSQSEIAFALETRICPRCRKKIIEDKDNYFRCSKCDFKFHF